MSPSVEPVPIQKFDELLAQTLGNGFQIKHLEWKPLTAAGENYGSVILAITVTLSRSNKVETLNLVTKRPPTTAYLLDLFNSPVSFKKELHFYSSMAKAFINLQLENGINEKDLTNLVPKYFGGRLGLKIPEKFDEQAAIVLENLKCVGYDIEDRIFGLDKKHTEFAIQGLAKLHAFSTALMINKPELYKKIATEVVEKVATEASEKCVFDLIQLARSYLQKIEEVKPYLEGINKTIEHGIQEEQNPEIVEEPWGTLLHNDFWVNNMMFRHDERGEILDMKIVDFQLCSHDYGVKDLIFFLVSSATKEILDNKLDDMLDLYYSCFIRTLQTMKVDTKRFSKQKFDEIVNRLAPQKFNQCIMMLQVIKGPRRSKSGIDNDDIFINLDENDVYNQKLLHTVRLFDKRGWLLK